MAEREDLKGRDDKFRKDDPTDNKSGQRSGDPGRSGDEPGRQGQSGSGSESHTGNPPGSPRKGTGSDDSE